MTTLFREEVKRGNKYIIHHRVDGDLGNVYEVRAIKHVSFPGDEDYDQEGWNLGGSGITVKNLEQAIQVGKDIEKYSYSKALKIWEAKRDKPGYEIEYLPERSKLAMELAPFAYGEYAEKIRQRHGLKKRD